MCVNSTQKCNLLNLYNGINTGYYNIDIKRCSPWNNEYEKETCEKFIRAFFAKGRKATLFEFDFDQSYCENGKHLHTVSLYLLGSVFLKHNHSVREGLREQLKIFLPWYYEWYEKESNRRNDDNKGIYDFLYTWYLTALYHDVASCVENIRVPENPTERQKNLEYYLGELDITYSPYGEFPYRKLNIPQRFSENLIKNYFYYRANKGSCEHGILAGYLFFDRFVKNFLGCCQNENVKENVL